VLNSKEENVWSYWWGWDKSAVDVERVREWRSLEE
jgi:hypothetical protein